MADATDDLIFVKDLIGKEDILFGEGEVQQIRDGELVLVTKINAGSIPYRTPEGDLITVAEALDFLYAQGTTV